MEKENASPKYILNKHEFLAYKDVLGITEADIEEAEKRKDGLVCIRSGSAFYLSKDLCVTS